MTRLVTTDYGLIKPEKLNFLDILYKYLYNCIHETIAIYWF
ncbi:MAG: hypothetical protein ACI9EW_002287 [Cellvibrionaceae bacterium]|jgi:hypothetical protein